MLGKTPIAIPYPKINEVRRDSDSEYDFVFSGKETKYRSAIIDEIKKKSFSLESNAYQKISIRRKRNQLISKAKINLNIPQDENWKYPSMMRILLALSLGIITVSVDDGAVDVNENFYAKVSPGNLDELEFYLKQHDSYYKKYLEAYNEVAAKAIFPNDHFRIWAENEGAA